MKRFGFHADQLYFNMRNPSKIKYVSTKQHGNFEVPKNKKTSNVEDLYKNYQDRLDYEKYMNPFGLKPTISSKFEKPAKEIDFLNHEVMLMRSPKPYDKNQVAFRVSPFMSKPEIKQYLSKVYKLPVSRVDTVNKMGKIKMDRTTGKKWRKPDWKKAIVTLDYEVDNDFKHFN